MSSKSNEEEYILIQTNKYILTYRYAWINSNKNIDDDLFKWDFDSGSQQTPEFHYEK